MIKFLDYVGDKEQFETKLINSCKDGLKAKTKLIYIKKPIIEDNKYVLNCEQSEIIVNDECSISGKSNGYVYAIFDKDEKFLYIGSTQKLKERLKQHLIANPSFHVDKEKAKTSSKTHSKINKVFEHLKNLSLKENRVLMYGYFKVEPWYYYTAIESLLIEKVPTAWNDRGTPPTGE